MTDDSDSKNLPVLRDIDNIKSDVCLGDDLRLAVIEGLSTSLPEYFQTAVYALNLHTRGKITANINHQLYEINAPCFSSILIGQSIGVVEASEDMVQYILSFSPSFADELNLRFPQEAHINAYMRPFLPMTESQMQIVKHYLDLLHEVLLRQDVYNAREVSLNLVRSMTYFVYGLYDKSFTKLYTLSRSEELAGRFLSLVEVHCHEHHSIDWYADEMCLTPKYIANVVKQVTGRTAYECITQNLVKQAKSLLQTTTLPVQQIADRLGFQNQSHFGTFFRKAEGVSPREYRNNFKI